MSGLQRRHHAEALRHAQDLWDLGCRDDAMAELDLLLPHLHPKSVTVDAEIVTTLATYCSETGDPGRGLLLLSAVPLEGARLTDSHLDCLAARCECRAAIGDIEGARHDRATIARCDPRYPALVLADAAIDAAEDPECAAWEGAALAPRPVAATAEHHPQQRRH